MPKVTDGKSWNHLEQTGRPSGFFKDTGSSLIKLMLIAAPTATGGMDATTFREGRSVTLP